ncbi:hypothetical protein [Deinococcus koreensis]|uniref:Serine hydrolase n=1 Tax=Deinococcus koreensis TaxID=2054903 RepID=A0A2K3UWJ7_9DEIO|nr:hypothetical protein [Deinococcus koreensis]PNY80909.1 hypothetical protein CVO96_05575 [Deinococcus koreensis]
MPTLRTVTGRTSFALLTVALLGGSGSFARQADAPDSMGTQLSALSGSGLMLASCQERMQRLGTMLGKAGYGPMRSRLFDGTTMIARWYHPEHHTTVLAVAGWQDSGNAFSAGEFAGLVRWNELAGTP